MDGLHIAMPGVFMRMHYIKACAGLPPSIKSKCNLVQPTGTAAKKRDWMENHLWIFSANVLREYMDLVLRR